MRSLVEDFLLASSFALLIIACAGLYELRLGGVM